MCDRRKQAWAAVFIGNVLIHTAVIASPIYVPQFQPGSTGRNIRHLPCVSRRSGETGVCMFAFTCAKANGTHLGTCIDRFYFGSCCKIDDEPDIYPQDNSIDDGPSPPRPSFVTTHGPIESNDIPEYFARPKPTVEKNGAGSQATTTSVSSSTPSAQASTSVLRDTTKFVTRKPTTTTIETTTQTTRLSTFQTVQSAPEGTSSTEATLSKSTVGIIGTVNNRPSATVSPSTTRRPTKPSSTTSSSLRPSTENVTKQSVTAAASKTTTKRPVLTTTVQRPTHTSPKPSSLTTRRPVQSTITKTEPATTQKTVSSTRFPPRNSTSPKPLTQVTTRKPVSSTKRPPATTTNATTTTVLLPVVTKRPVATTKKPTTLTKRPSSSSKPIASSSLGTTLTATTRPHTTSGSLSSVGPSSTGSTLVSTESRPSTAGTTTASTTSQKITATNTVITTKSPDHQKPSTTKTTTTLRTTPKTTTKTSTIRTTTVRPTTTRPTTTAKTTTDSKTTTFKPLPLTTANVKPTKITSTTTRTTKPSEYASTATTTERTRLPLPSTIGSTVGATRPKPTTAKPTKPLTKLPVTTSSIVEITTVGSSSLSTFTVKDEIASTNIPPTKGQDVNNTLEEIPLTTYSPGLVTWSSNSDEISTRVPETSTSTSMLTSSSAPPTTTTTTTTTSTPPEHTETDWSPITTPDDWIMIQLPTEKLPQTSESTTEPVTEPTMQSLTSAKPITESTTISDYVTKKPTMMTTLSTIASVTIDMGLPVPKEPFNMSNYKEVCGRRLFPESRIVGGSQSSFGKWPWQISLRQWRQSTYLHKCGAALLNQNWAITAAHCVDSVPPGELLLRIGEHDLVKEEEPYGYQERRVQIVASHPQFDARTFEYDLALLRFYEPILPFQPNILPICLPDDDETYVGRTAYVTGWGRLHDDGPLPAILQEVAVPVVNNTVCEDMYRTAGYVEHIPHIFICAGWRNGGFDSCEGDSGGPMVIQRARDKRWILAGIISWGIGCAVPNQPGVYTRISEFREWINQILQF